MLLQLYSVEPLQQNVKEVQASEELHISIGIFINQTYLIHSPLRSTNSLCNTCTFFFHIRLLPQFLRYQLSQIILSIFHQSHSGISQYPSTFWLSLKNFLRNSYLIHSNHMPQLFLSSPFDIHYQIGNFMYFPPFLLVLILQTLSSDTGPYTFLKISLNSLFTHINSKIFLK
jgi:hypothetical protein